MERLTRRYPTHVAVICENCDKQLECRYGGMSCGEVLRDRLAAYEDTDLTPKEVNEHEAAYIEIMTRTYGPLHQKIGQWLQADQDGRLIVIPCREGDVVYDISDGTPYATRVLGFACLVGHWACWTARSYPDLSYFGERIFMTREEAEVALKKKVDTSNDRNRRMDKREFEKSSLSL